jgi:Fe-S oxidoreductase
VLNLKLEQDAKTMRAIAEEAFAMVKAYKGSHSGEHGDGLVRSEFHEAMYGRKTVELFEEVKDRFDPAGLMNPGKIVRPSRMNDRSLFRYKPDYGVGEMETVLDWSAWPGAGGGFQGAVEMCNNNGECRKLTGGIMCPSFRVTGNERDATRGRANSLRLAISGQLGPDAFASEEMLETLKLCVSCKGCRRECPTGVDMARMKIEVLAARNRKRPLSLHDRLVAYLPRYAPYAVQLAPLMNARDRLPGAAWASERMAGFSAARKLPRWRSDFFRVDVAGAGIPPLPIPPPRGGREKVGARPRDNSSPPGGEGSGLRRVPATAVGEVALFADTFNTYFEPENLHDAAHVLARLGYRVTVPRIEGDRRPLCCGRTFLSAGLIEEAKTEARRTLAVLAPIAERNIPIVGLEPSCLLTLRDEYLAMRLGETASRVARHAVLLEELLASEAAAGRIQAPVGRRTGTVLVHGHCHQKSFGVMASVATSLGLVDGLRVETVESSCCGMAGAFGYGADSYEASMAMAELSLLPAVRGAAPETIIAADGFSCRHQIQDGTGRPAHHVARLLRVALD